jgi:periplasmic copper chaperone A
MTLIVAARYRCGFAWHKSVGALAEMPIATGRLRGITVTKSALLLMSAALLAVASCKRSAEPDAAPSASTESAPDAKPGIALADGVLVLPPVKGRPGAAYFTVTNGSAAATTLAAISIIGVNKAEMHETRGGEMAPLGTLELKPGETARFERGGKHVMAFGIGTEVKPGGTVEVTLTFADGDKISAPLKVQSLADAISATPGMNAGMGHGEPR